MKIELEEKDLNYIENINRDLELEECPPLYINTVGSSYYINFTCNDIARANAFAMMFLHPNYQKELEEKFGITFNSLNYCHGDQKIESLKVYLQQFIEKLDSL